MSNVQLQTSVMWLKKLGIWAKACDGLGGWDMVGGGGGEVRYLPTVCVQIHKDKQRHGEGGNSLIGYVIGISMPDAEI